MCVCVWAKAFDEVTFQNLLGFFVHRQGRTTLLYYWQGVFKMEAVVTRTLSFNKDGLFAKNTDDSLHSFVLSERPSMFKRW